MLGWLRGLFGKLTTPSVSEAAASLDPEARRAAAEKLGETPEAWAADELEPLLADAHAPVREAAQASLRRLGIVAVPVLLRGLRSARDEIAVASADLLGESPRPEAVEPLLVALKFAERPVQLAARRALLRHGPAAVPALRAASTESQPWVQAQIAGILKELGSDPASA